MPRKSKTHTICPSSITILTITVGHTYTVLKKSATCKCFAKKTVHINCPLSIFTYHCMTNTAITKSTDSTSVTIHIT